jgi:prepilin-type N-terminal cleavage/methylation domain-containing protein
MLSARLNAIRARAASQRGFTLIELLVATAAGMAVLSGMVAIMTTTMHQQQVTFSKIDATRRARLALATVENEMHSGCVDGSPPVQVQSTPTKLIFLSYSGNVASPTPLWHELSVTSGKLTDTTYGVTASTTVGQAWARSGSAATRTLLTNVTTQGSTPIFQYFAYQAQATPVINGNVFWIVADGTNLPPGVTGTPPFSPLSDPASTGLAQTDANNTVEVLITLKVNPAVSNASNPGLTNAAAPVTDAISLRLTTPPDYAPQGSGNGGFGPCE